MQWHQKLCWDYRVRYHCLCSWMSGDKDRLDLTMLVQYWDCACVHKILERCAIAFSEEHTKMSKMTFITCPWCIVSSPCMLMQGARQGPQACQSPL